MEINGLPLHPLVVHATVVVLPVTAVLAVVYGVRPRPAARWWLLGLAIASAALAWLAATTGDSLLSDRFGTVTGELRDRIERHEQLAGQLQAATYCFAVVAVALTWLNGRGPAWLGPVLRVLVVGGALAVLVLCVMTGDAGAKAAWGQ